MIVIVAQALQERTALAALCASRGWVSTECDSLRAFRKVLVYQRPEIVLTRHRLGDGYSDDVIAALVTGGLLAMTKVVVLIGAGTLASIEARQVALGADCVQRDPVRTDVLAEYLARYRMMFKNARHETPPTVLKAFLFAGASVDPVERTLCHRKKVSHLTPHEVDLAELLIQSEGGIITYDTLYSSILDRRFRGDTSNMRVLLGKLAASARRSGVQLRRWVKVIPKMGYRYQSPAPEEVVSPKPRRLVRPPSR